MAVEVPRLLLGAPKGRRLPLARPAAVGIGSIGHSYGLLVLLGSLGTYEVVWLNWAAYVTSLGLVGTIALASASGRLRNGIAVAIGIGVIAVDFAGAVALGSRQWTEGALWCVGTSGILIIMLALVASLRLTAVVFGAHVFALMLGVILVLGPGDETPPRTVLAVLDTVAIPLLGMRGAHLYRRALAAREAARTRTEETVHTTDALERAEVASLQEIEWVTGRIRPALETVAAGGELTPVERADLHANARRLRSELSSNPQETGLRSLLVRRSRSAVELIGPDEIAVRINHADRALLTALLAHLACAPEHGDSASARAGPGGAVTVALTPEDGWSWVTVHTTGEITERLRDHTGRGLLEQASSGPLRRLAGGGGVIEFKVRLGPPVPTGSSHGPQDSPE